MTRLGRTYALFFAGLGAFLVLAPSAYTSTPAHDLAFDRFGKPALMLLHLACAALVVLSTRVRLPWLLATTATVPLFWAWVTTLPKTEAGAEGFNGLGTAVWCFLWLVAATLILLDAQDTRRGR